MPLVQGGQGLGVIGGQALIDKDTPQDRIDILAHGHAAAHVNMGAPIQFSGEFRPMLPEEILDSLPGRLAIDGPGTGIVQARNGADVSECLKLRSVERLRRARTDPVDKPEKERRRFRSRCR